MTATVDSAFAQHVTALCDAYLAAYAAGDAEGCAAVFTAEARLDHPFGPPARGRAEIATLHAGWVAEAERDKRMEVLEGEARGTLGAALLTWSAEVDGPDGAPRREGGVSLAVLHAGADGWRIHRMALLPDG